MGLKSNPNGANQYQLDPRQKLCWENYANPKSETFGNGTQSAIKAGYDPDYADQITTIDWFLGKIRRLNLLSKAEKVLEEMLDMEVKIIKFSKRKGLEDSEGEVGDEEGDIEMITAVDPVLVKIKQDTAKFVAERQGKHEGYSTRTELTGNNGTPLIPEQLSKEEKDKLLSLIHD